MKPITRAAATASLGLLAAAVPAQAADVITLYSFTNAAGNAGYTPESALTIDAAGDLYGTTDTGGAGGGGTVFTLNKTATGYANQVTTLASFSSGGPGPRAPAFGTVVLDGAGNVFGTTIAGGSSGGGTVFKIAAGNDAVTTLASFTAATGTYPIGPIVLDPSTGALWGTTSRDGNQVGTVWDLPLNATQVKTAAVFGTAGVSGSNPESGLIEDAAGNLYGTTSLTSGATGNGTVFEVAAGTHQPTTLATLSTAAGQPDHPIGSLAIDGSGNLYGVTNGGGAGGAGAIFEVKAGSGAVTTLASFNSATTGGNPYSGLIVDAAGNLFGATLVGTGGAAGGAVFELAHGASTITTLADFASGAGGPIGRLTSDAAGNLFGTTSAGGANGVGTIFEVTHAGFVTTLPPVPAAGPVPEPGTWGLMLAGVGLAGAAMRRKRGVAAVA